jgi:hypothetical protein
LEITSPLIEKNYSSWLGSLNLIYRV